MADVKPIQAKREMKGENNRQGVAATQITGGIRKVRNFSDKEKAASNEAASL